MAAAAAAGSAAASLATGGRSRPLGAFSGAIAAAAFRIDRPDGPTATEVGGAAVTVLVVATLLAIDRSRPPDPLSPTLPHRRPRRRRLLASTIPCVLSRTGL